MLLVFRVIVAVMVTKKKSKLKLQMQKLAQGAELQLGNVREIRKLIGQTLKGYQHRLLM